MPAEMRPASMTMRCIPICTIVASICCRLRASDWRTKGISSDRLPDGIGVSGSTPERGAERVRAQRARG